MIIVPHSLLLVINLLIYLLILTLILFLVNYITKIIWALSNINNNVSTRFITVSIPIKIKNNHITLIPQTFPNFFLFIILFLKRQKNIPATIIINSCKGKIIMTALNMLPIPYNNTIKVMFNPSK